MSSLAVRSQARRREPTPEQKAKAQERRQRFREMAKQIAEMSDEQRAALAERVGLLATVEGRALSPYNTCLVAHQFPGAAMVGGFRQWLNAGRCVRKGEHGLMIWVPVGGGRQDGEGEEPDAGGEPEHNGTRFIIGTVFDVSQTDAIAPVEGGAA